MSERKRCSGKTFLMGAGTAVLFFALFLRPEDTSAAVTGAMRSYCTRLIPVLFPYMVLSHFFCTYGLLDPLDGLVPVGKLFGMGKGAFPVFLLGHLCGYPVGAKMAGELVRQGRLGKKQGAILCAVSSGASPAFLLYAVGDGLWQSVPFGGFLLGIQVLTGLLGGMVLGRTVAEEQTETVQEGEEMPFARCFCEAVGGSALQIVSIGGYIVFFSLLVEILPFPGEIGAFTAAVLEFSTGTRLAAETGGLMGLFCTGFAVGFGGLSVLAQTAHMLGGSGISLRPYGIFKLFSGILCGGLCVGYGLLFPALPALRYVSAASDRVGDARWMAVFFGMLVILWYWGTFRKSRGGDFSKSYRAGENLPGRS